MKEAREVTGVEEVKGLRIGLGVEEKKRGLLPSPRFFRGEGGKCSRSLHAGSRCYPEF